MNPKEQSHLEYKYLKSYAGPLVAGGKRGIQKPERELDERRGLIKRKTQKVLLSYERKKYGGIRMC